MKNIISIFLLFGLFLFVFVGCGQDASPAADPLSQPEEESQPLPHPSFKNIGNNLLFDEEYGIGIQFPPSWVSLELESPKGADYETYVHFMDKEEPQETTVKKHESPPRSPTYSAYVTRILDFEGQGTPREYMEMIKSQLESAEYSDVVLSEVTINGINLHKLTTYVNRANGQSIPKVYAIQYAFVLGDQLINITCSSQFEQMTLFEQAMNTLTQAEKSNGDFIAPISMEVPQPLEMINDGSNLLRETVTGFSLQFPEDMTDHFLSDSPITKEFLHLEAQKTPPGRKYLGMLIGDLGEIRYMVDITYSQDYFTSSSFEEYVDNQILFYKYDGRPEPIEKTAVDFNGTPGYILENVSSALHKYKYRTEYIFLTPEEIPIHVSFSSFDDRALRFDEVMDTLTWVEK